MSELPQSNPRPGPADQVDPGHRGEHAETEQEQSELDLGVVSTGSAPVDQALGLLETVAERPIGEHPAVFEQVLADLSSTMADGTPAGTEPAPNDASDR